MPPVPQYPLIHRIDYPASRNRFVSLCVVKVGEASQLRIYKWKWNPQQDAWRVSPANLNLEYLDLPRIISDARILAGTFGISLPWAAEAIKGTAEEYASEMPHTPRSAHPICPNCGATDGVVPISYGVQSAPDDDEGVDHVWGGLVFTAESPLWHCKDCERQWGYLMWTDERTSGAPKSIDISDEDIPF